MRVRFCNALAYSAILIAGYILLGCGASLTIPLPNDHAVIVANSSDISIVAANDEMVVKWSIGELSHSGDIVYGTIMDPDTRLFQEYFVLDTRTSMVEYYPDQRSWSSALSAVGISDLRLRRPSAFYNSNIQVLWRALLWAAFASVLLLSMWSWRSLRKTKMRCMDSE